MKRTKVVELQFWNFSARIKCKDQIKWHLSIIQTTTPTNLRLFRFHFFFFFFHFFCFTNLFTMTWLRANEMEDCKNWAHGYIVYVFIAGHLKDLQLLRQSSEKFSWPGKEDFYWLDAFHHWIQWIHYTNFLFYTLAMFKWAVSLHHRTFSFSSNDMHTYNPPYTIQDPTFHIYNIVVLLKRKFYDCIAQKKNWATKCATMICNTEY